MDRNLPSPRIEISLDNLLHNLAEVRSMLPQGAGVLAVVKDCAYGCGSAQIAKTLENHGNVGYFAVCRPAEALFLRQAGIKSPLLIFGRAQKKDLEAGHRSNFTFVLNDLRDLALWKSAEVPVRFHCNIDTRMHRMGILPSEVVSFARRLKKLPLLEFEGAFTHLANADEPGTKTVAQQLAVFNECLAILKQNGTAPRHIHYANSAGLMRFNLPGSATMARPGIALYGCKPDPAQSFPLDLKPVVSLKSRIVKMKRVPANTPVSYGGNYTARRATVIATVALGYAHGLPRSLGNKNGCVLIGGKRFPVVGNITMDYLMVDVGPKPLCKANDEVVAIGNQGKEKITPDDLALSTGTIGYEILTGLDTSLDRVYFLNGKVTGIEKGFVF